MAILRPWAHRLAGKGVAVAHDDRPRKANGMQRMFLVVLVSLVSLAIATVSAQDFVVVPRTGAIQVGPLPAAEQWWAASSPGLPPPTAVDGAVVLRNGTLLVGIPVSIDAQTVVVRSDRLGVVTLPLAEVAAVSLGGPVQQIALGEPGAVFVNGDTAPGRIAFLDPTSLGLDTGRRVLTIPRSRVRYLRLAPLLAAPEGWQVWATNGDRLTGQLSTRDGTLTLKGILEKTVEGQALTALLLPSQWSAAWWEGPACRPATAVPFSGMTPAIARDAFHDGRPLTWQDRVYARGFAIRGAARLEWAKPDAAHLIGEVALIAGDSATLTFTGGVSLTVLGGATPQMISVPISAGPLVMEVTAPPGTGSPLVVIGWPFFIR